MFSESASQLLCTPSRDDVFRNSPPGHGGASARRDPWSQAETLVGPSSLVRGTVLSGVRGVCLRHVVSAEPLGRAGGPAQLGFEAGRQDSRPAPATLCSQPESQKMCSATSEADG